MTLSSKRWAAEAKELAAEREKTKMGLVSDKWAEAVAEVAEHDEKIQVGVVVQISEVDNGEVFRFQAKVISIDPKNKLAEVRVGSDYHWYYFHELTAITPLSEKQNNLVKEEGKETQMTNVGREEREILVEWTQNEQHHVAVMKAHKLDAFALQKFREGVDVDKAMYYWTDRRNVLVSVQTVPDGPVTRSIK